MKYATKTMLIKAQRWIEQSFAEGSRPSINTVRKWFNDGEIDGVELGKSLYIEVYDGKASVGDEPKKRRWNIKKNR